MIQTGAAASAPVLAKPSVKEEQELCQAFSEVLLAVQDVDEQDADQPQLCSQYVKDIYKYLHILEVSPTPPSVLLTGLGLGLRRDVISGAAACACQLHARLRSH